MKKIWLVFILPFAFIFFQNCGDEPLLSNPSQDTSISQEEEQEKIKTQLNARVVNHFSDLDDLELWRERIWAKGCGPKNEWEVCFDGFDIPGFSQRAHLDWDNARDDDWDINSSRKTSWITNLQEKNGDFFMRVDRTVSGFKKFSGHFWRRDEFLTTSTGMEAEFSIRILSQSQINGVMFYYNDDSHQFKIHFSPTHISFHPLIGFASKAEATNYRRNIQMTQFYVKKEPKTGVVRLWANGTELFKDKVEPVKRIV